MPEPIETQKLETPTATLKVDAAVQHQQIKPQVAKEPPSSVKDLEFKVEDFETLQLPKQGTSTLEPQRVDASEAIRLAQEQAGTQQAPVKKVENKKEEPKKVETEKGAEEKKDDKKIEAKKEDDSILKFLKPPGGKKEEPIAKVEDKTKPEVKTEELKQVRDLTGYKPEEAAILKQMSNPAYEYTTSLIRKNKELEGVTSKSYLQHEHAYLLDPGYHQVIGQVRQARAEMGIYEQQLADIEAGKPIKLLTGIDDKGQFTYSAEQQPSAQLAEKIRMSLYNANNASQQANSVLQQYPARYKQNITQDIGVIEGERKARFPWAADEKLLDHTIDVAGIGPQSLRTIKETMANIFPAYMRSNPLTSVVGDMMIALQLAKAEISELKSAGAVTQVKEEESTLVEPTSNQRTGRTMKEVHGVKEFHALPLDLR